MFKYFCTQNVPINTKKIPTKPIITGFVGIYLFIQTPCSYNIIVKYWLFFVDFYIHNIQISCLIHSFRPNRYHTGITVFLLDRHTYMVLTPCITAHKNYNSHFIISLLSFLTIRTINTGNISGLPTPPVTLRFSFPTKTQKPASSNSFKFSDKLKAVITRS